MLKMSVKTPASWSALARSTNPGLVNVDLFKGLTRVGYGERDHTVAWNSWYCHACFSVAYLEASMSEPV